MECNITYCFQEFAPTDEELAAHRKGEVWDPEKARLAAIQKVLTVKLLENEVMEASESWVRL